MPRYYVCERCGKPIDSRDYLTLANDERYKLPFSLGDEHSFGIFHVACAMKESNENHIHIHLKSGNLALVEISWEFE